MSGDSSWLVNFHNISSGIRKNGVLQKMCNNNSGKIMHSSPDEVEVVREKKSKKLKSSTYCKIYHKHLQKLERVLVSQITDVKVLSLFIKSRQLKFLLC